MRCRGISLSEQLREEEWNRRSFLKPTLFFLSPLEPWGEKSTSLELRYLEL